jgi:hypothetical protein
MVKGLSCVFHAKKVYIKVTLRAKAVIFIVSVYDCVHVAEKNEVLLLCDGSLYTFFSHPHASAPL